MRATPQPTRPILGTIVKSGRVLDLFTPRRPEWGVSEVARMLEMPKSGAHSQLSALAQIGVLRRTSDNRYRLGWRLISLTHTLLEGAGLREHADRELQRLVDIGGPSCSAQLMVLDGDEVISVSQVVGEDFRAGFIAPPGARLPVHSTASGKVLLAYSPLAEPASEIDLVPVTAATIVDPDELEAQLVAVRNEGLAWDCKETLDELSCVAAPVRDSDGSVAAALSISGPPGILARARLGYERQVSRAARRTASGMQGASAHEYPEPALVA
jgi:DNA-binding IclR family transcriptional regulator